MHADTMGAKKSGSSGASAHHRHHVGSSGTRFNNATALMVKNVGGTAASRFVIPRLHDKYVAHGGTKSPTCAAKLCTAAATATAHVRHADGRRTGDWHLTRFCASHNAAARKDAIPLRVNAKLVAVRDITKT